MRNYTHHLGDVTFPVVSFRRRNRYDNGVKTDTLDSCYTIFHNYEQIDVIVADDGKIVTQQQVKDAADAGAPIVMAFKAAEITLKAKTQWELQASGTARQAAIINAEKSK